MIGRERSPEMKPAVRGININAWAPKVSVDNRISLQYYYRIADNLLKQASVYREEKNLIDLYIILLRFSSLLCETIPSHRDYHASLQKQRASFMKKLLGVIDELESLKPEVQRQVDEMNRGKIAQLDVQEKTSYASTATGSLPPVNMRKQPGTRVISQSSWKHSNGPNQVALPDQLSTSKQLQKPSLTVPFPKEETLSRHSILGPSGLRAQWNGPAVGARVQYPSNAELTQMEIISVPQANQYGTKTEKNNDENGYSSDMASVLSLDDGRWSHSSERSSLSIDLMPEDFNQLSIKQPSPPPVLAFVHPQQELAPIPSSKVADPRPGPAISPNGLPDSKTYQHLHIPVKMMECFLRLAEKNTAKNLETCGVLAGSLKNRVFCVTTLIIPKQEATSDSCQTTDEEEIFDFQDKRSLFPLGWIHTHPTQTCFMSSVDLHTHYSYQIMLPEAIAIVMAPTDETRTHGIFHLSEPGGVSVIRNCQQRGFHPHEEPSDGSPLYEHCSHVYMNPNLQFEVSDMR